MNYKTTLVVTAVAVAAIAALGSAFPMVGTAFAQIPPINLGDENTANSCSGEVEDSDCRQQGFQVGRENEQTNTFGGEED
jgi:hypothetical protein